MPSQKSTLQTWLQLVRAPNLFTVPGDPLAGFLLAANGGRAVQASSLWGVGGAGAVLLAIMASLCFYCFGLLLNDLADFDEDRRERPSRPLPSGAASPRAVAQAASLLAAAGIACSFFAGTQALCTGLALLLAVTLYDFVGKKIPLFAQVNMGACRGLSLLLGAAAAGNVLGAKPLIAASILTIYIAVVTSLSRFETQFPKLPPWIGMLIRALLFLQAAFCIWSGTGTVGIVAAIVLVALWPVSRAVGRRFYAS